MQREAKCSEEEERGGGHPRQDGETERVGCTVDELLSEGFDWFGHLVAVVRWEIDEGVGRKKSGGRTEGCL